MKKIILIFNLIFIPIFIISCGDNNSVKYNTNNNIGYLIDTNVSGVQYYCNDKAKGITKSDGSFEFNYSCNNIIFSIGSITLATMPISAVKDDNKFFLTDITNKSNRADTNNTAVKNISRLLQSLDDDKDPTNGINITSTIRNNITNNISYDISSSNINEFDLKNILIDANLNSDDLISSVRALVHVEQTLRDNNIYVDTVAPYEPYLQNDINATDNNITSFTLYGEKNTKILLNGVDINISINSNGKNETFELNTSMNKNTFKEFNISLQDSTGKISKVLKLDIFKDTDDINSYTFPSNITVQSPKKQLIDINATDNSQNYGLPLVYDIQGKDKKLFDINQTNGIVSFKNDSIAGNTYNIQLIVRDLANHKKEGNITITVN